MLCRVIIGLTQFTNKAHIARATLEAVCFQTREVSAMQNSSATWDPVWGGRRGRGISLPGFLTSQFGCQTFVTLFQCHVACHDFLLIGPSSSGDQIMLNVTIVYSFSYNRALSRKKILYQCLILFLNLKLLDAMNMDCGIPLTSLQVDGGMTVNNLLMQLQADILGISVGK